MRAETELLFDGSSEKERGKDKQRLAELPSPELLEHQVAYEELLILRARRRDAEAGVRERKFDLIARAVLLALVVIIGVAVAAALLVGASSNPFFLKAAAIGASLWTGMVALLMRLGVRRLSP